MPGYDHFVGVGIFSLSPGVIAEPPFSHGFNFWTEVMLTPKYLMMPASVSATDEPLPFGGGPAPWTV